MKKKIASKIVEFWHMIEFLSQDSFPVNTKENVKRVNLVKKLEKNEELQGNEIEKISQFTLFYETPFELGFSELIQKDDNFYKRYPVCSNNLHLCFGKIKREFLVSRLYQCLGLEDDRPEEDKSEICLISLKINKDGTYVENSFRMSPLVWGIHKCCELNGKINGAISTSKYNKDILILEEQINKIEPLEITHIQELYKSVYDTYIKPTYKEIGLTLEGCFIYSRYNNETTCKRDDDKAEDVSELVKGFYTDDLEVVRNSLEASNITDNTMLSDIVDYIVSAYYEENGQAEESLFKERIDIRSDKKQIESWLFADKAPSGKWPSRFNPALMQQIAINIGINETKKARNIFSVNGPPGTGKTTLLKEIIASNIVNRAVFICKYNKSDDAFIKKEFHDGGFTKDKGYDKFCNKYYAFVDEGLADFSMLIASCNNAAVENITKELPDGEKLISGLSSNKRDKEEVAKGLEEINNLFDISKSITKESYKVFVKNDEKKVETKFVQKNDIYFSWLAHLLMDQSDEIQEDSDFKEWGLISAPMGKSSNIGKYCRNVLIKLLDSFYCNNAMLEKRHDRYIKAKTEFNDQLLKVEEMKKELSQISRLSEKYKKVENDNKKLLLEKQENINALMMKIKQLLASRKETEEYELELDVLKEKSESIRETIIKKEDSRKWHEILLGRWIQTEKLKQIAELKQELDIINKVGVMVKTVDREDKDIASIRDRIQFDNEKLQAMLSEHSENMHVINNAFWDDFESTNEDVNTKIQTLNPWVTEGYNRQREKLFYLALQLHKEFVLSSKACRDNFKNLLMMWKYKENHENQLCTYTERDKNDSYRHLINTLFLLTPVMSTTFASVGRFLGNIKEPGCLGLLIVDEAGQAAPQVAVGALWRCKKAIVVGDPKQVEPVVTDDADAIKKAFSDECVKPYMSKVISVQEFADKINRYGSFIKDPINEDAPPAWIGCPLVVHRRCINPMFNISNELSYGRTMKIQTAAAKPEEAEKFVKDRSCWLDVSGQELGNKNHFVYEQGKAALDIIISSFNKYDGPPNLYVISPFTTVINGIKDMIAQSDELKRHKDKIEIWLSQSCGTVHKFQGKEANEVILLLGCDERAKGAVKWVKPNIVNVAATRAKYRLYIIGEYKVWKQSRIFEITRDIMECSTS